MRQPPSRILSRPPLGKRDDTGQEILGLQAARREAERIRNLRRSLMCLRSTLDDSRVIVARPKLLLESPDDIGKRICDFRRHHADERALDFLPRS